jgi:hypothetical protein
MAESLYLRNGLNREKNRNPIDIDPEFQKERQKYSQKKFSINRREWKEDIYPTRYISYRYRIR